MTVTDWLLDSDPAIRWQVRRDLLDAPADEVAADRARVAREGWGARLLAARDADGQWAGGAHFPADMTTGRYDAQPWTSTSHSLTLLRLFGIAPDDPAVAATIAQIRDNCRWEHDGQRYFDGEVEPCINGQLVANAVYFGLDMAPVVARLLADRLGDGGWNCYTEHGSTVSSFASTLDVLEGLWAYELAVGGDADVAAARRGGEEYLLTRSLFRGARSGTVVDEDFLRFAFPARWQYDVLRALEYFAQQGAKPDPRMADAVTILRDHRSPDGTWALERTIPGAVHVTMEADGAPSRWNTLRALRVLRWYDSW